jgi:hypothetical protein
MTQSKPTSSPASSAPRHRSHPSIEGLEEYQFLSKDELEQLRIDLGSGWQISPILKQNPRRTEKEAE